MTRQAVEVQWEVGGQPVWWPGLLCAQADQSGQIDYIRQHDTPAHRSVVQVVNTRELLDVETGSLLRWRKARTAPTFTATDLQDLQESQPAEPQAVEDAARHLRQMSHTQQQRLHTGMQELRRVMAAHLAALPPGHVVTPEDIAAAAAELRNVPEADVATTGQ